MALEVNEDGKVRVGLIESNVEVRAISYQLSRYHRVDTYRLIIFEFKEVEKNKVTLKDTLYVSNTYNKRNYEYDDFIKEVGNAAERFDLDYLFHQGYFDGREQLEMELIGYNIRRGKRKKRWLKIGHCDGQNYEYLLEYINNNDVYSVDEYIKKEIWTWNN